VIAITESSLEPEEPKWFRKIKQMIKDDEKENQL
jgi:hypothetical protein